MNLVPVRPPRPGRFAKQPDGTLAQHSADSERLREEGGARGSGCPELSRQGVVFGLVASFAPLEQREVLGTGDTSGIFPSKQLEQKSNEIKEMKIPPPPPSAPRCVGTGPGGRRGAVTS